MNRLMAVVAAAVMISIAGCSEKQAEVKTSPVAASPELQKLIVVGNPPAAIAVMAAKKDVKDGDKIVLEGRIKDFVDGKAAFTIADTSLASCKDKGESCPTPWDFCCESAKDIAAATATVKVVGDGSETMSGDLKGVNKLDHLVPVVVEGKAKRDASGNLEVAASKVYVKP